MSRRPTTPLRRQTPSALVALHPRMQSRSSALHQEDSNANTRRVSLRSRNQSSRQRMSQLARSEPLRKNYCRPESWDRQVTSSRCSIFLCLSSRRFSFRWPQSSTWTVRADLLGKSFAAMVFAGGGLSDGVSSMAERLLKRWDKSGVRRNVI